MSNDMIITTDEAMERVVTARREQIERRIHDDLNCMGENYIDIGRCLNIVKDEGLVPHGQWVSWVREHAQMNERNAQRVMRAAREVESGSPLAHLDFSKVMALLAIPAEEREAFAADVDAESLSVRQLQAAVKEREEAMREIVREKERAEREADKMAALASGMKSKLEYMEGKAASLEIQAAKAQSAADERAQQEIDRLRGELDDTEEELKRRAKAESDAKAELLRLRTQVVRGTAMEGGERLTADELATATRAFIGQVAVLPHMGRELATCSQKTRDAYLANIDMIADWCERARMALNTIEGEVLACE